LGYLGFFGDTISSVPGVLQIIPGKDWCNYKQATQLCRESPPKNTTLTKVFDGFGQCRDMFPPVRVTQQGTPNIRLWWPLMYEPPTTTWTLDLLYATLTPVQFPGESAPSYVHRDKWVWDMDASLESMKHLLELFHEVPFGLDEVPLISNEVLYPALQQRLDNIIAYVAAGNTAAAGMALTDFEMEVSDACIAVSPSRPNPAGPGTGIANSFENPACCKLMVDAEYVGKKLKIWNSVK